MNVLTAYLSSVSLATALSLAVILLSRKSLRALLVELCGNDARAQYWTMFTGLFLLLCTLYGVLAAIPPGDPHMGAEHAELVAALSTFRSGVLWLLIASLCVAFVLLRFVARYEELAVRRKASYMTRPPQELGATPPILPR